MIERQSRGCAVARLFGWSGALLLLVAPAAGNHRRADTAMAQGPRYDPAAFQTGDVLFRRGRDFVSGLVLVSDRQGRFSHAGIVMRSGSTLFVIHTLPREGADVGGARIEPLAKFLAPDAASEAGLYRLSPPSSGITERASSNALDYARRRVPFDDSFDLTTDTKLYCTELVWRAFREAGVDLLDGRLDDVSPPLTRGPVITPSNLARSRHLQLIAFFEERRDPS